MRSVKYDSDAIAAFVRFVRENHMIRPEDPILAVVLRAYVTDQAKEHRNVVAIHPNQMVLNFQTGGNAS